MKQEADAFAPRARRCCAVSCRRRTKCRRCSSRSRRRRAAPASSSPTCSPTASSNGDQFDTYKYRLGVTGPYHQVAEFLSNVGSLPRIVAPINLSLTPTTRGLANVKPKKNEQFLDAKFGIQTYVAHASDEAGRTPAARWGHRDARVHSRRGACRRRPRRVRRRIRSRGAKASRTKRRRATNAHIEAEQHPDAPGDKAGGAQLGRVEGAAPAASTGAKTSRRMRARRQPVHKAAATIARRRPTPPGRRRRSTANRTSTAPTDGAIRSTRCSRTNELRPTMSDLRLTGMSVRPHGAATRLRRFAILAPTLSTV